MKEGTIRIFRDKNNELRWSLDAKNGRNVADCSQGYSGRRQLNAGLAYQSRNHKVIDDSGKQRKTYPTLEYYLMGGV